MKRKVYCLNLYTSCNHRCKMCSVGHLIRARNKIDFIAVQKEISKVAQMGYNVIDFGGSEPTLYPKLFEAICYSKNLGFNVAIFTNGHRLALTHYIKKLIPLKPIAIKTSFHSHREDVFDYITGTPGSYARTLKAIENVHKYLSTVPSRTDGLLVNVVINRYNYKNLPEIMQFLFNRNVRLVKLTQLLLRGNLYKNPDLLIGLADVRPYFVKAITLMKKLGMDYDFDSLPICFMESESKYYNPKYGDAKGLKLIYCNKCEYNNRCVGIPKTQVIVRYKKQLLKAGNLFPPGLFESIFSKEDIAFIKKLK